MPRRVTCAYVSSLAILICGESRGHEPVLRAGSAEPDPAHNPGVSSGHPDSRRVPGRRWESHTGRRDPLGGLL